MFGFQHPLLSMRGLQMSDGFLPVHVSFSYRQMHSRSPFHWSSILTMQNTYSTPWTFVHWKRLASIQGLAEESRWPRLFPFPVRAPVTPGRCPALFYSDRTLSPMPFLCDLLLGDRRGLLKSTGRAFEG